MFLNNVIKCVFEYYNSGLFFFKKLLLMKINMKSQHLLVKIDEKLTDVAMKLLSLVCSSASMERCFSSMGLQSFHFANDSRKIINSILE